MTLIHKCIIISQLIGNKYWFCCFTLICLFVFWHICCMIVAFSKHTCWINVFLSAKMLFNKRKSFFCSIFGEYYCLFVGFYSFLQFNWVISLWFILVQYVYLWKSRCAGVGASGRAHRVLDECWYNRPSLVWRGLRNPPRDHSGHDKGVLAPVPRRATDPRLPLLKEDEGSSQQEGVQHDAQ